MREAHEEPVGDSGFCFLQRNCGCRVQTTKRLRRSLEQPGSRHRKIQGTWVLQGIGLDYRDCKAGEARFPDSH